MNSRPVIQRMAALAFSCLLNLPAAATLIDTNGFIENSQLDLALKNVWMINTADTFADDGIGNQNAWAQGVHLDYRSGWFNDWLGIDASWYSVSKLYANDYFYGRDLLRDDHGHARGFSKVGQLYAKAHWGDDARYLRFYAGWQQIKKLGILTITSSRAAPSTWEALRLETGWQDFSARAVWATRFSERDEPEKRHFYTLKSNKKIDYIATGDISWMPSPGNKLTLTGGESKDYILRYGIESDGKFPLTKNLNLLLRGVWYHNHGLSEWEGSRGFTHNADHYYVMAGYQYLTSESGLGWSKTKAHLNNNLGRFYWHLGRNTRGAFNSGADGPGNDYINDGEQMFYLYSQYKFSPQLTIGIYGNYGFNMSYQSVSLKEWEYGSYVLWAPEQLKSLSIFAAIGPSYSWKLAHGSIPSLTADKRTFRRSQGIGAAIQVEYRFHLL